VDLQLDGKRALVTGSTSGIGRAVATALAGEGAVVAVHGRDRKRAEETVAAIAGSGGKAVAALGDLSRDDGRETVVRSVESELGGIDILVNNVGGSTRDGWPTAEPADWAAMLDLNVVSAVRLISAFTPGMRARNWGRIIQIGSAAGASPPPSMAGYGAAKAALANLTVSLAKHLAGSGVTANIVSPGPTMTEGWREFALSFARSQGMGEDFEAARTALMSGPLANPSARLAEPGEVASLVSLVASPLAASINGANLRIDGGLTPTVN
jgi:NAD(P)-dependent dehydrogenase (short-subunit alcohol dehydrogenase family)